MTTQLKYRFVIFMLVSFPILFSARLPAAAPGLTVEYSQDKPITVTATGTVRDKVSGTGIANALVRAHVVVWRYQGPDLFEKSPYQEVVTDAQGQYQVTLVAPLTTSGAQRGQDGLCVYASAPGYETKPQYSRSSVTARNCSFTNLNFELSPGKKLTGVVVDAAGQPVPDAYVRVQSGLNGDWDFFGALGRTFTGPDGSFTLWTGAVQSEHPGQHAWLCVFRQGVGWHVAWDIMKQEDLGQLRLDPERTLRAGL